MNIRLNAILLLIVAILSGWYFSQSENEKTSLSDLMKREGAPEYTGQEMTTMVYDAQGKPQYFAQAQEIKRFETSLRTEFVKPLVMLFDAETAAKQWRVTAEYAEITREKILNLTGNVKIQGLDPHSRLTDIETDRLSIQLDSQDIFTESVVKSKGMGFTSTGKGLRGNLKSQTATLIQDVKTYIEPTLMQSKEDKQDK